jgi:hypothetical protein
MARVAGCAGGAGAARLGPRGAPVVLAARRAFAARRARAGAAAAALTGARPAALAAVATAALCAAVAAAVTAAVAAAAFAAFPMIATVFPQNPPENRS